MSEHHRPHPPPEARRSGEATAEVSESSRKRKVMKDFTEERPKPLKRSRNHDPVVENVVHGASSHQSIEHPTMSENSSGYMNQALSREPASQVQAAPSALQEGTSHQTAVSKFQDVCEDLQRMNLLENHATSMASSGQNAQADVDIADNFQATYLEPLRIFDTAIEKIAKVVSPPGQQSLMMCRLFLLKRIATNRYIIFSRN
ncbi:uncharacterized protein EDB91DRAFT_1131312 [Suillus paluster]|uniref:uncharacterized protein n=1 Tax=Suillus paluster TaxID=48578 RepID=UPI001B866A1F|nr:uncharacterized protein EDB91DRAFT_1131312 [Suillus paluster]KAG1740766.1 hypothetical protein EDB91DRAFT_1131312 [Suillus paluster]